MADIEALADRVRESMYADDRQSSYDLTEGLAALRELEALAAVCQARDAQREAQGESIDETLTQEDRDELATLIELYADQPEDMAARIIDHGWRPMKGHGNILSQAGSWREVHCLMRQLWPDEYLRHGTTAKLAALGLLHALHEQQVSPRDALDRDWAAEQNKAVEESIIRAEQSCGDALDRGQEDTARMDLIDEYLDGIDFEHTPEGKSLPILDWFIGDGSGHVKTRGDDWREAIDNAREVLDAARSRSNEGTK